MCAGSEAEDGLRVFVFCLVDFRGKTTCSLLQACINLRLTFPTYGMFEYESGKGRRKLDK